MPNISLTAPYTTRQAELDRRRKLAQALMQESMTPLEMPQQVGVQISPLQGLAKLLSGAIGAYRGRKLDEQQRELDTRIAEDRTSKTDEFVKALLGEAPDRTIQLAMAQPQTMGGAMSDVTPEGSRQITLPPSYGDIDKQDATRQALAKLLSSPDPQQQQLGQVQLQDVLGQQREQRAAARSEAQAKLQAALQSKDPLRIAQAQNLSRPAAPPRIDPLSAEGIAAQQRLRTPVTPTLQPENVMLDGKEAKVLHDQQGNYFDVNTRQPVTGRITPYNPPPSPRQKGDITPNAEANLVGSLTKQWQTAAKDVQELYRANTIMSAGMDAARRGDLNAGSQAVLVTFQKFLDPQSVVRESEYARSPQGISVANRIRGYTERLSAGGAGVPLSELETLAKLAQEINTRLASEGNSLLSAEKDRIRKTAERYSIPSELVFPAYNYAQPGGAAPRGGFRIVP